MKIEVSESYQLMSEKCVNDLLEFVKPLKTPLICTASGDTPKGMYKELIKQVEEKKIDISVWNFISLDEWVGMNENDEGSCRYHLNNDLFHPLNIAEEKIIFFDGRAGELENECAKVDGYINKMGGIDVAIVGLGMNGHVGMNEPGTPAGLHSHIADIDAITQQVGQKYFKTEQQLTKGLTLGLASLQEASFLMLLANGAKKSNIVREIFAYNNSPELPATSLLSHKNICVYLDKEAASLIIPNANG